MIRPATATLIRQSLLQLSAIVNRCANTQPRFAPNPLEHLSPMLLPILLTLRRETHMIAVRCSLPACVSLDASLLQCTLRSVSPSCAREIRHNRRLHYSRRQPFAPTPA